MQVAEMRDLVDELSPALDDDIRRVRSRHALTERLSALDKVIRHPAG